MTQTISFLNLIENDLGEMENLIRSQAEGYHPDIQAALNYLLGSGGKRIRPSITILISRILQAPRDKMIYLSGSIELLHTATLVHDDLIDGSLLRRGIPTLNSHWSSGATVLMGDFLFSAAARLAANTDSIPVLKIFSRTLSIIVNGEIDQLLGNSCQLDHRNYIDRIYSKTGSLFETSAHAATLITQAQPEIEMAMRNYGYHVGIAFQIIDDILDFTGSPGTLGKPIGSDLRQGLLTLPALFYFQENPDDHAVMDYLNNSTKLEKDSIDCLIENIRSSESISKSYDEAENYIQLGMESLQVLPDCPERKSLIDLANFIVKRNI